MSYPKIDLGTAGVFANNEYRDRSGDRVGVWTVPRLAEMARDLVPFDLPLCCVDIGCKVYTLDGSAKALAYHMKRCADVDMSLPVIMDEEGYIMDGWHRVIRALVEGLDTIKAVRFEKTPPADYWEEKGE